MPIAEKPSSNAKLYLAASLIVLLAIASGLGAYYFWATKTAPADTIVPKQTPEAEEIPIVVAPPTEKYSREKPTIWFLILRQ